jgi:hypothetical protein
VSAVTDDRWSCPRCGLIAALPADTYRPHRASLLRMARDTHLCPARVRR